MKGVNKYVNEYIRKKTYYNYKIKLTEKLRVNDFLIHGHIIKLNKTKVYQHINDKNYINELIDRAINALKNIEDLKKIEETKKYKKICV